MTDNALRVGLDVSAVSEKPAGAGRYILELARALSHQSETALSLISRRNDSPRWLSVMENGTVLPLAPNSRPARLVWEQIGLAKSLGKKMPDIFHSPHYTMPRSLDIPQVVTIHDMTFFDHSELHERVKVRVFRRAITEAVKNADALVCVSATTADRLTARFSPKGKVVVIEHGVDHEHFAPSTTKTQTESDQRVLKAHGVHKPYIVFIGTLEPRKNVTSLVEAFSQLAQRHRDIDLVLVGQRGWHFEQIAAALKQSGVRSRIRILGYVDDHEIPALLRNAVVSVYPSQDEGFGLPVLEALACGTPVITTAGSAHSELVDDAALQVTPRDANQLAAAMESVVNGDPTQAERRAKGLAIAAQYSWDACATAHRALYGSLQ